MEVKKKHISLVESYRNFMSNFSDEHLIYFTIIVAAIVGFFIVYLFTKKVVNAITGSSILIVGGCEAGKSALLHTLAAGRSGKTPKTVTSLIETMATYNCGEKSVKLVDIPGHERVRDTAFEKYKADAHAILFLLDSATLQSRVRDVAEQLFSILTDKTIQVTQCPIAVVCNKQDLELAKSSPLIERALQREIEILRDTSRNKLGYIQSGTNDIKMEIGVTGQPFTFSDLSTNSVTFIESTILDSKDIDDVKNWIATIS